MSKFESSNGIYDRCFQVKKLILHFYLGATNNLLDFTASFIHFLGKPRWSQGFDQSVLDFLIVRRLLCVMFNYPYRTVFSVKAYFNLLIIYNPMVQKRRVELKIILRT